MSGWSRRQILKGSAAAAAASWVAGCRSDVAPPPPPASGPTRVVFVRFGGGVRYDDVLGDESSCLAPTVRALGKDGTLYASLRNSGLTRHDCATRYLLTGRYGTVATTAETLPQVVAQTQRSSLVHEAYRRQLRLPQHKALVVGLPEFSQHPLHGANYRAASFCANAENTKAAPFAGDASLPNPLERTIANQHLGRLALALSTPAAPMQADRRRPFVEAEAATLLAGIQSPCEALDPAWQEVLVERALRERSYVDEYSTDELLTDLLLAGMRRTRPDLSCIGFVSPDLAHRGSWREYAAAMRNIDAQVGRIVEFLSSDSYYRGRTLLLVAPDIGRGQIDFTEHENPLDEPSHRWLFLTAWGHGAKSGRVIRSLREQTAIAPTIAKKLGFEMPQAETEALEEVL